jgi:hypothetical protein
MSKNKRSRNHRRQTLATAPAMRTALAEPGAWRRYRWVVPAAVAALAPALAAITYHWWASTRPLTAASSVAPYAIQSAQASFVGAKTCAGCHTSESVAWQSSQHAKAMQHATEATVLDDFHNASFTYDGIVSTFFRRDGKFFVTTTDGADGTLGDFEILYTFGLYPLQQYLVAFPDGRMQALSIAWDARPKEQGGAHR